MHHDHERTGHWPKVLSGNVFEVPDEKWGRINAALAQGRRGLPGGSSLAQLLFEERGLRCNYSVPDLTIKQILKWADAHHEKTGQWPNVKAGSIMNAPGEKWGGVNGALGVGVRGLPGGSSLAQLLAERRDVRNAGALPDLTIRQILKWADEHHEKTGKWPKETSGDVFGAPGEKWSTVSGSLHRGRRGLPVGSSLAQLLAEKRGVRNRMALPDLTIKQILKWADEHHEKTGQWPTEKSGNVFGASGEKWLNVKTALAQGRRGLPSGSSLAQLLAEQRGLRNKQALPDLTTDLILKWVEAHHVETNNWPTSRSGEVLGAPGETWVRIDDALRQGYRGLRGGSSLAKLLADK